MINRYRKLFLNNIILHEINLLILQIKNYIVIINLIYYSKIMDLEKYFKPFRDNIVGIDSEFQSPFGKKKIVYADWIASGRLYAPIEDQIKNIFGPNVGNTHSEASYTGVVMTKAYHLAHKIIKKHVNAGPDDVIITAGSGMTGVINKLQRILGLRIPERAKDYCDEISLCDKSKPVVFVTHLEHHSNHTSWLETLADVVVLTPDDEMNVDPQILRDQIVKYKDRPLKIGAFSACSNVTGIRPKYYELARIMHENDGYCFVDFAASAPYEDVDMHPKDEIEGLDAIYFSPHKFLGGPGSSGVLIFNKKLYKNQTPDNPGGGTVSWTNRWGEYSYLEDIEIREDGGTPGFIQAFRVALSCKLKEQMGTKNIHAREQVLIKRTFEALRSIPKLHILADNKEDRIGVFSFYVDGAHHNLIVKLLNDRYGIQVRGGCSCAGTYGHFLLQVNIIDSKKITSRIDRGDLSLKPGWVRLSLHPTVTDAELEFILNAIREVVENLKEWEQDYEYSLNTNEFYHRTVPEIEENDLEKWFEL